MLILVKDNKKEKYLPNNKEKDMEEYQKYLKDKSSDNESVKKRLFRHIS